MAKAGSNPVPADGVVFELTLNPVSADKISAAYGYRPKDWKYKGREIEETQTRRFKLVRMGFRGNLHEIREKFGKRHLPDGHWLEAFRLAFPQCDGKGSVGYADPSWTPADKDDGEHDRFPVISENKEKWHPGFRWTGTGHHDWEEQDFRWLVAC